MARFNVVYEERILRTVYVEAESASAAIDYAAECLDPNEDAFDPSIVFEHKLPMEVKRCIPVRD